MAEVRRFRDLLRLTGRDREGVVQAAKMAVAAVVAWWVARQIHEPQSFIAPYAAVFMMSRTIIRSFGEAARHVTTLVLGIVVAFLAMTTIPWMPLALLVAVFVGMLVGRWHRLGADGIWVGVVALLMITYGTAENLGYLVFRVGESLLGAAIGVAVNLLVLPPMWLREGDRAVADAAAELADLLRTIANGVREGWDKNDARQWYRETAEVERAVRDAEIAAERGRESTWFNPRALLRRHRRRTKPPRSVIDALHEVAEQTRHISQTLVSSDDPDDTVPRTGPVFDRSFATLLEDLARAVDTYRGQAADRVADRPALREALARARDRRAALARKEPWPEHLPPEDWSAHAALVLAAERALTALLRA